MRVNYTLDTIRYVRQGDRAAGRRGGAVVKKRWCCLYVGVTMALCLFFSVGAVFLRPDADAEGRELTPMPSYRNEDGSINWDFTTGLEAVFAERFAGRTQLVTAESLLKAGLFATGSEQVIVGRAGYLFFGETLDDYMGTNPMTDEEIATAAGALAVMANYAEARGAQFLFVARPEQKHRLRGIYARPLPAGRRREQS